MLHFTTSAGLVLALWFVFDYSITRNDYDISGLYWFVAGNGLYSMTGIGLAFMLKDNRAFCKYICPITVFLKMSSFFSLLRIKGESALCIECKACSKTCPMDILIPEYIQAGQRVLSNECVMCMTCIDTCPTGALQASIGFDPGGKELLQERRP